MSEIEELGFFGFRRLRKVTFLTLAHRARRGSGPYYTSSSTLVSTHEPPRMASTAPCLIFSSRKCHFFSLKVSFIEIDAQPQLFPHDHEEEEKDPQAPLDLRWGEVRLS